MRILPNLTRTAALASLLATAAWAELIVPTNVAMSAATNRPAPEYSSLARSMKVSGDVTVEVRIGEDGSVIEVKPLTGSALLAKGVVSTVKQWKFKPFDSSGKPTVAVTTLRFTFK
ncbi:MAG: energy transducer TonB [Bryobacteraceae bacterium]